MIDPKDSRVVKTSLADMIRVVAALEQHGHRDLAQALKELTQRVAGSPGRRQTRHEIIEYLVYIGQQAALHPEQRNPGLLQAALRSAKDDVEALGTLSEAWDTYGQAIEEFFSL